MPSKCFASWASPNWTRPPRRRDKNRSCSDQPQNPPPYLLGVTGHNVKHALAAEDKIAAVTGQEPLPQLQPRRGSLDSYFWDAGRVDADQRRSLSTQPRTVRFPTATGKPFQTLLVPCLPA